MKFPAIVAEVGCNHKGRMEIAEEMIKTAAIFCKVDYVKFQKRCVKELLSEQEFNSPHPNPRNSFGDTYGKHREYLEFDLDQHKQLIKWCGQYGVKYACSAWDITSAKEIASLHPDYIKIPSACNLNFDMLGWLADNYEGGVHLSMGMTSVEEENKIISFLQEKNAGPRTVIYACTSGYPVPFRDACLLEITRLKQAYGSRVAEVGFSGHHLGIAIDIAATALGSTWIERHFTLDRTWKGTDHAASLEPGGMMKLVRDVHNTTEALTYKESEILEIEIEQRKKLKRNAS